MKTAFLLALVLFAAVPALADAPLPSPWKQQDIGAAPAKPGSAQSADGVFTVAGSLDLWGTADGCHFVYQAAHGDVEVIARVAAIDNPGAVAHAKGSLCIRESVNAGARGVTMCVTAADGTQFLYRDKADGKTTHPAPAADAPKSIVPKATFPCWLKLVRHGNTFSGYESMDGEKWQLAGQITLDLPADTVAGLAATSHKPDVQTKVTFDHVKISAPPAAAPGKS
ncbi:MAG TPA: hypothetical protein VFE47_17810 [Tepidisphaeraceae bacterium]|jgi:hypothetical protein|nr:hypothetical protein [Tepidisphaeraceae bacterium]